LLKDVELHALPCGHGAYWDRNIIPKFAAIVADRMNTLNRKQPPLKKTISVLSSSKTTYQSVLTLQTPLPNAIKSGEYLTLKVTVQNKSDQIWMANSGIYLGNRWFSEKGGLLQVIDGKIPLTKDLPPEAFTNLELCVKAPHFIGIVILKIDLAEEGIAWFEEYANEHIEVTLNIKRSKNYTKKVLKNTIEMFSWGSFIRLASFIKQHSVKVTVNLINKILAKDRIKMR